MSLEFPSPTRTKLKECDDASWCRISILERCPHQSVTAWWLPRAVNHVDKEQEQEERRKGGNNQEKKYEGKKEKMKNIACLYVFTYFLFHGNVI